MIYGLIPPELHAQLLDYENFHNRTNGVEELKTILSDLDLKTVSSDSIVEFIHFLHRLLEDTNFKVLYGTLQVISLLVQKLNYSVDRYYKQIVFVALKTLGDTRIVSRNEYMNVFRQLMRIVGPQKVLDLVIGHLKHKNSRVREDVLNIITAAMLTHPRKDFSIPDLCFVVAPFLADNKKRVRHAALELFAVFDYCLDTGKKQPLMKAIDRVELTGDMEGLMAAVQARRARHILPRLSADGMVEYALVIPKPGQRRRPQLGSGADLDWVLNGGRVNSARSLRAELDSNGLNGYGSLGSLTDDLPLHRRTVSAGKGKNKLPWERSNLTVNLQPSSASNGKSLDKASIDNLATSMRLNQESYVTNFGSAETFQPHTPSLAETVGRLRRSGSLDLADAERGELSPSGCSALPMRTSRASGTSASSFPQALSAARLSPPIFPVTQQSMQNGAQQDQLSKNLNLDLSFMNLQDPDEEPVDREEMMNSLRSLRNSAAKKRAKVNLSGSEPDPDSPDTAMKLVPTLDSLSHASLSVTSPLSESSHSSLCSPPTPITSGTKSSPWKGQIGRVPSGRQKTLTSVEASSKDKERSRETVSSPHVRPAGREPVRALRPMKGSQIHSTRASPAGEMSEGVVGRGVFGSLVLVAHPSVAICHGQEDSLSKVPWDPPAGVCGNAVSASHADSDMSLEPEETVERVKMSRFTRENMHQHFLEQQEAQRMERMRQHLRHTVSEVDSDESARPKDFQLNDTVVASSKTETPADDLASSPTGLQKCQNPVKCFSPHHQPSPPAALPTRRMQPRRRRATSLNRTHPSLSHSSDEFTPGTPKKDPPEQKELRPFSKPDFALTQSFRLLNSEDWEKKIEGLGFLRGLAQYHTDVLISRLHDVCLILIQEVRNLRSGVSRMAIVTLGEFYSGLQKGMDQELEATTKALLHKAGESNAFIRQDVDAALDSMVQNCTPTRGMSALLTGGLGHLNPVVRKCTSQHLATLVEKIGAGRLLSGTKDLTDRILPAVAKLAQDSSQETRFFGRQMLLLLSSHHDFDKMMAKYIPDKDLAAIRDTVLTLKTKGLGEMPHDTPSARGRHSIPGGGLVRVSSHAREPQLALSKDSGKAQTHSIADKTEYIKQLAVLLSSKDFRERIKGIDQLVTDCEDNPYMILGNMFPIFDAFKSRLQESNSKVNLYALEALQKIIPLLRDNLAQVVYILVPAIVDNHLNSKNDAVYMAATGAIQALISNIDNTVLLQIFCTKAQFLSGKAKVDLVDKVAELVKELYPRKPQLVEQKVLPLLWHILGTSSNSGTVRGRGGSVRGATAILCQALYMHMGQALIDCAASQPSNIHQSLNDFLKNLPTP
ncbi:TOG array regulator of axonemal microtubules protein 1 isoform X3 [Pygocentrus nattereri]|uniref:TOG array regulator of axonemal microtubules protein 1 isoform X3 n=1 Tax=Pygocentrus nattereri TaxID=42514 RepID=UPI0008144C66|nr:TOG array regulator of axonemal microtubules protein 1 isoform X3 [Pygocentrus nattereri]